jgi:hypothetical protein
MNIKVPQDIGGELRLLPNGPARAVLEKIMLGKSHQNKPKATFRYTITEEMVGIKEGEPSAIGETVLETYSLQEQSMWKINGTFKEVTGERIPQGDFSEGDFEAMLNEKLTGTEWDLILEQQVPSDGSSTEPRTNVTSKQLVG